jgi:hypothetical protein
VPGAEAAVGGVLDFGGGELGAQGVLYACEVLACDLEADARDAQVGEAEGGVVRVAEDLLEVPAARAGGEVGVRPRARLGLDAELVDDSLDAAVEDVEVVDDREHGEAVRGGVRVHAAAEGERERVGSLAVLAEALEHGAGRRILFEKAADDVRPGLVHGLEAVEEAQVLGGEELRLRLHAAEDVVEELGVEALHVWAVCGCAGGLSAFFGGCVCVNDIKERWSLCMRPVNMPLIRQASTKSGTAAAPDFSPNDATTILIRTLTEFSSVFFSIVCFSRLGAYEYYYKYDNTSVSDSKFHNTQEPSVAANLVLFVTLVIFQFPWMNAYIVFTYDRCVIGGPHKQYDQQFWRIMCCLWLLVVQMLGVLAAWGTIDGARKWKDVIWNAPQGAATDAGFENWVFEIAEEFFAVTALLVGYIHLTYLNFKTVHFNIFESKEHLFSKFSEPTKRMAIPMPFMLHITLLVAGLLRCFPSAHLSPHVSFYLLLMQYSSPARFGCRIAGGVLAFGVTWALFWFGYAHRMKPREMWPNKPSDQSEHAVLVQEELARLRQAVEALVFSPTLGQSEMGEAEPFVLRRSETPASAGMPSDHDENFTDRTSGTAISFNNAYRHVYRAM